MFFPNSKIIYKCKFHFYMTYTVKKGPFNNMQTAKLQGSQHIYEDDDDDDLVFISTFCTVFILI